MAEDVDHANLQIPMGPTEVFHQPIAEIFHSVKLSKGW